MIAASVVRACLAARMRRFRRSLSDPLSSQNAVLRDISACLTPTARGRELGVDSRDDYAAFAAKVPIVTYDELVPWIERQMANENRDLVGEPVLFYERTSGSTAPAKYIPTTASLKRSFSRMFALWLHDLLAHGPRLRTGRFYFSVPPPREARTTARGVRIGTDNDLAYVGAAMHRLVRRYVVGLDQNPEVVSIWNPSYLLTKVTRPIESVKLVSCWAAADAKRGAEALRELFPNAMIQPKGLLATEAPITIPLFDAGGFVPLVDDVFLEFFDGDRVRRLHEIEIGAEYEVIVSQRAGLVRYRIGDRVRVTHRFLDTPCLDFLGRADDVCDLAGEKLSEGFAREVVASITGGRFGVIVPDRVRSAYVVIVDRDHGKAADELLMASPRYAEARLNGQLAPARVVVDGDIERRFIHRKPVALVRDRELAAALTETHVPPLQ